MPRDRSISRRSMLKGGLALPVVAGWPEASARPPAPRRAKGARNVIFLAVDGMSTGVPSMAEPFSHLVRGVGTHWMTLAGERDVARGLLRTEPLEEMVTDSAAAATAWATGSRVRNGSINVLPDGTELTPLGVLAKDTGRALGLVSTATVTHATPAAFGAVSASRADEFAIAPQYQDVADVVLGGGHPFFAAETRPDGRDVYAEYRAAGYTVCRTAAELAAAPSSGKLLGIFSDSHLPYHIDVINGHVLGGAPPRLADMARAALERLAPSENGFLLQIEGARVDHAAHANDPAAMLWEQLEFDDCIGEVVEFARRDGDTLVVITTDHAVGNPGLMGMGAAYADSPASFESLASIRASFERMLEKFVEQARTAPLSWRPNASLIDLFRADAGIELSAAEASVVVGSLMGRPVPSLGVGHGSVLAALGQFVSNTTGVGWTGTTHTSDIVLLLAVGPGREALEGLLHHEDLHRVLARSMGIAFENPKMTPEEAKRFPRPVVAPDPHAGE
jgi:alkaline phosphatase